MCRGLSLQIELASFLAYIQLLEKICFKMRNAVFLNSGNLQDYRKSKFDLSSPDSLASESGLSRQSSIVSPLLFSPKPKVLDAQLRVAESPNHILWTPNIPDLVEMYMIGDKHEKDEFLSHFIIGKLPLDEALISILAFFETLVSSSSNISQPLVIVCKIIKRHNELEHFFLPTSLFERLTEYSLKCPTFEAFKTCFEILIFNPNPILAPLLQGLFVKVCSFNFIALGLLSPSIFLKFSRNLYSGSFSQ
jgi:hypothetical protein